MCCVVDVTVTDPLAPAAKKKAGRPRSPQIGKKHTVGVSFRLAEEEYRAMIATGLPWKAILRRGYTALTARDPLLERVQDLEDLAKNTQARAAFAAKKLSEVLLRLEREHPRIHQQVLNFEELKR